MWSPLEIPEDASKPWTDYARWRMQDTRDGAHVWEYLRTDEQVQAWPQTDADKYWTGQPLVRVVVLEVMIVYSADNVRTCRPCLRHKHR